MNQDRYSDQGLFEAWRVPPLLGMTVLLALWCLLVWYLWTVWRKDIGDRIATWSESQARAWRSVIPWFIGVWVLAGGMFFVVGFVRLLG